MSERMIGMFCNEENKKDVIVDAISATVHNA